MLVGIYEVDHKHWNIDGAPWDYGFDLIPEEIDRIAGELRWRGAGTRCCSASG